MFDIGWQELFIVAVIGIIVVGPKDLPAAIRTVTRYLRKARSLARDFQNGLDDVAREAELQDVKKGLDDISSYDLTKEIENTIDPTGDVVGEITDWESNLNEDDTPATSYTPDDDAEAPDESEETADETVAADEDAPVEAPTKAPVKAKG